MVEDRAVERFGRDHQAPGRAAIGVAWARIAAWMIVRQQDAGAFVKGSIAHDRAKREVGSAFIAGIACEVQALSLLVDVRDPQAFALPVALRETAGEKALGGLVTIELQREFGTLILHA